MLPASLPLHTSISLAFLVSIAHAPAWATSPSSAEGIQGYMMGSGAAAPHFPTDFKDLQPSTTGAHRLRQASADGGLSVDTQKREAVRTFYNTTYMASESVLAGWQGNVAACQAGQTTEAYQAAILQRINWFRAMAGLPAQVVFDPLFSSKAQEAALMMSANNMLSHTPPTSWTCYTADGSEAARNSNIYLGRSGPVAISGYIEDWGPYNAALGHRRWILYPQTQMMGTGDVVPAFGGAYGSANSLWVFDANIWGTRPTVRDEFVAWPPKGYVPYQTVYPRWSFAYPKADFSGATVTMRKNGVPVVVKMEDIHENYGENTLAWIPSPYQDGGKWYQPPVDEVYEVTVGNVVLPTGETRAFTYTVTVFDPAVPSVEAPTHTLTVQSGAGGTVTSDIGDIDCGTACTADLEEGTSVTLTATPNPGFTFQSWNGDCLDTLPSCTLVMNAEKAASALFAQLTYAVTVLKTGTGMGTVSGSGNYTAGQMVTLKATAATGSTFTGWTPAPCAPSFLMPEQPLTCTAAFTKNATTYSLSVGKAGTGTGTVVGAGKYAAGKIVTIVARPATGATFVRWLPTTCGTTATSRFKMPAKSTSCVAIFTPKTYRLTLKTVGNGTVSGGGLYKTGQTVTLKATPANGFTFVNWGPAPCDATFTMPANVLTCTATFAPLLCVEPVSGEEVSCP